MPTQIYDKGRQRYAQGVGDWGSDSVKMLMVSDVYEFDPTHSTVADIPSEALLYESLIGDPRTGNDGYLDGPSVIFNDIDRRVIVAGLIVVAEPTLLLFTNDAEGLPLEVFPGAQYIIRADPDFGGYGRL